MTTKVVVLRLGTKIQPTPDQQAFIHASIESGRIGSAEEPVLEAMELWEEREHRRLEILVALDTAKASIACGEGIEITRESMSSLAADVKQRGRARLIADRQDTSG